MIVTLLKAAVCTGNHILAADHCCKIANALGNQFRMLRDIGRVADFQLCR